MNIYLVTSQLRREYIDETIAKVYVVAANHHEQANFAMDAAHINCPHPRESKLVPLVKHDGKIPCVLGSL